MSDYMDIADALTSSMDINTPYTPRTKHAEKTGRGGLNSWTLYYWACQNAICFIWVLTWTPPYNRGHLWWALTTFMEKMALNLEQNMLTPIKFIRCWRSMDWLHWIRGHLDLLRSHHTMPPAELTTSSPGLLLQTLLPKRSDIFWTIHSMHWQVQDIVHYWHRWEATGITKGTLNNLLGL